VRLQSLKLQNFMPYRGEQEIGFAVDGARNVTIVYGDNMRGKTSLLNGLRWVLYGKVLGRHLKPIPAINILNKDAAHERDFLVQVSLRFSHEDFEYEVIRSMRPKDLIDTPRDNDHFDLSCVMRRSGIPVSAHLIEDELNKMLPESISRFWLFDGELLQEYEQLVADATDSSDKIRDAIEKALGVPTLLNGKDHLAELLHRAQRQFSREGAKDTQHSKLEQQTFNELEDAKRELKRLADLHEGASAECDQLDDELKRLSRAESVKSKIEENERQRSSAASLRDRAMQRRSEEAPKAWLALVASSVATRRNEWEAALLRTREKLEDVVSRRVAHRLRLASLQSGACTICGQPLADHHKQHISSRDDNNIPADEFELVSGEFAVVSRSLEKLRELGAASVEENITQAEREFDKATVELNRLKAREQALLSEIPGVNLEELGRMTEKRGLLQREIGRLNALLVTQQSKCSSLQKKYDVLVNAAASGQQASTQTIARKVRLLTALSEVFDKSVEKLRQKLRLVVEQSATETFKKLTTEKQYTGLVINERYGLEIRDHLDRPVSVRSAGAEQIVALSLIDGLSHASGSAGVLVMDTPFGRLDLKHRAQVLSYLPRMAKQVVLLVHEGELSKERDLAFINDHVSGAYEIERVSATQSEILGR
jgi:DNA sulfur modification protein DndD